MLKTTPLHDVHQGLGARLIDFGGWDMPVQYGSIIDEAKTTRTKVGLFDIGHMGRIELLGPDAVATADWVMTCNVGVLKTGRVKYGLLLNERGTCIDDVLVYRDEDRVHLVVNAGNRLRDVAHVREQVAAKNFECQVIDAADPADPGIADGFLGVEQHMLSLQGPNSEKLLQRVVSTTTDLSQLGYFRMTRSTIIAVPVLISRTGYTGEDGFEIFYPATEAHRMWDVLMAQGSDLGVGPVGLGARDSLRLEAGMPLYGNEMDEETTPLEAKLNFGLSWKKGAYLGRPALERQKAEGVSKTLVGFEVDTRRVPRHGCPLLKDGETIGVVASGTWAPTLEKNIGTGFVPPALSEVGSTFDVDIRGKIHGCTVVPTPFYSRPR